MRMTNDERRTRLVVGHGLGKTATDPVAAVRDLAALHSSDPTTPYLGLRARVAAFSAADLDRALYVDRSLWRMHAMRRTLFVVPADEGGSFLAGAGAEVAARERRRLEGWLAADMPPTSIPGWLAGVEERVLDILGDGRVRTTSELSEAVPELASRISVGSGKWTSSVPLSSRVLLLMAMEGSIVRARPNGSWRSSQYAWAVAESWFGGPIERPDPAEGRARLVRRYLETHGPATLVDVRWWTGWTARAVRAALAACGAVGVQLEGGGEGFVLPGGLSPGEPVEPTAALLPGLDPTPMGWKERDWYLAEHAEALFDRNGNAGPSVWLGGRIVGGWAQRPGGEVVVRLLEDVGRESESKVAAEADELTRWLGGTTVTPRFRTPLERELSSPRG